MMNPLKNSANPVSYPCTMVQGVRWLGPLLSFFSLSFFFFYFSFVSLMAIDNFFSWHWYRGGL